MRTLTPLQNMLYAAGGLLILAGAALPILVADMAWAFGAFACGTALFVSMQLRESYEGSNFVLRRLRRQQLIGAAMLVVTSVLMLMRWQQIAPFRADEWKITLAIAAVFEVYTAFRIPAELKKENAEKQ